MCCGCDGQGTLGGFLPADVGEVDVVATGDGEDGFEVHVGGFDGEFIRQKAHRVGQEMDRDHVDALDDRGFRGIAGREDHAATLLLGGQHRGRQRTLGAPPHAGVLCQSAQSRWSACQSSPEVLVNEENGGWQQIGMFAARRPSREKEGAIYLDRR